MYTLRKRRRQSTRSVTQTPWSRRNMLCRRRATQQVTNRVLDDSTLRDIRARLVDLRRQLSDLKSQPSADRLQNPAATVPNRAS